MCKYCWHPAGLIVDHSTIVDGIPHNPGCPVIEGNFEDWENGRSWGFHNSTEAISRRNWPDGKAKAFYFGIRVGSAEMEWLIEGIEQERYEGYGQQEY